MTIQREYNLPNCKLVVEGFAPDGSDTSPRPLLSVVTHVECIVQGHEPTITGGRSLLESLVPAVSHYAQEFLSGVPHPQSLRHTPAGHETVRIERLDADQHRLTISPKADAAEANGQGTGPIQLDLKTVQLFDLVEAFDQMLTDQQTLPDLSIALAPVSKQYAVTHEPVAKRAIPIALGLTSLTAAAIALFFLPIPERRVEPEPAAQASPAVTSDGAIAAGTPPDATPSPDAVVAPIAEAASPEPEAEASPIPEAVASPEAAASPEAEAASLDEALTQDEEITDPEIVDRLQEQLRSSLDENWTQGSDFPEELVYRVRVAESGDILGFRYMNQAAVDYANKTPLLDVQYNSTGNDSPEASAEFRVVFTPDGAIQVSPWHGRPSP